MSAKLSLMGKECKIETNPFGFVHRLFRETPESFVVFVHDFVGGKKLLSQFRVDCFQLDSVRRFHERELVSADDFELLQRFRGQDDAHGVAKRRHLRRDRFGMGFLHGAIIADR